MQKITDADGDQAVRNEVQLARVIRLIRLITEMKTNPRQTPEALYWALGISRSQYFQDKILLEKALGLVVISMLCCAHDSVLLLTRTSNHDMGGQQ